MSAYSIQQIRSMVRTPIVPMATSLTRPRPIGWTIYQFSFNRVTMHGVQLFQPLFFPPNVEVIEASLPNTIGRLMVNRFGQSNSHQHTATPTFFATLQTFNDAGPFVASDYQRFCKDYDLCWARSGDEDDGHKDLAYKSKIKVTS